MADAGITLPRLEGDIHALSHPEQAIEGAGGAEKTLGDILKGVPDTSPVVPTTTGLEPPPVRPMGVSPRIPVKPLLSPVTVTPPPDPLAVPHAIGDSLGKFFSAPYGFGMTEKDKKEMRDFLGPLGDVVTGAAMTLDLAQRVIFAPVIAGIATVKGTMIGQGMDPGAAQDLEDQAIGALNEVLTMSMAAGIPTPKMKIIATEQEKMITARLKAVGAPKEVIQDVIAAMNGARNKARDVWTQYPDTGGDNVPPVMPIHPDAMVRAYHGSPADIKGGFSLRFNRTGEGSNVRGYGGYFAENPDVSGTYLGGDLETHYNGVPLSKVRLQDPAVAGAIDRINSRATFRMAGTGNVVPSVENYTAAKGEVLRALGEKYADEMRATRRGAGKGTAGLLKHEINQISKIDPSKIDYRKTGNLYTAALDVEQEHLLDLDKPLSHQTPYVKEKIDNIVKNMQSNYDDVIELGELRGQLDYYDNQLYKPHPLTLPGEIEGLQKTRDAIAAKVKQLEDKVLFENRISREGAPLVVNAPSHMSGDAFYRHLSNLLGGDQAASQFLDLSGIPGNRFLDRLSRGVPNKAIGVVRKEPTGYAFDVIDMNTGASTKHVYNTFEIAQQERDSRIAEQNAITEQHKPTSNYVIFNDKNIRLLEKNGEPYEGAVGGPKRWQDIIPPKAQPPLPPQPPLFSRPEVAKMVVDVAKQVGFPIENVLVSPSLDIHPRHFKTFTGSLGRAGELETEVRLNGVAMHNIVSIALDSDDPRSTAFHEFFHPNQKFFSQAEKDALASPEGQEFLRRYAADVKEVAPDHPDVLGLSQRELEAYGTQGYIRARDANKPILGSHTIQKILDKLYQFIYNLRLRFHKAGITAEDVARHYATGGMKGRVPKESFEAVSDFANMIDASLRRNVAGTEDLTSVPSLEGSISDLQGNVKAPVPGTVVKPKMKAFVDEVLTVAGVPYNTHMAAVEQVMDLWRQGKITDTELWGLMKKHSVSLPELQFAGDQFPINRTQVKLWQTGLSRLRRVQGAYDELVKKAAESGDPAAMKALQDMMKQSRLYQAENRFHFWWKQVDASGRAFAVVLPKTVVANILGQGPRIGYDAVTALIDTAIQRPFQWLGLIPQTTPLARPSEAFNTLAWLMAPNAKASLRMLSGDRTGALADMKSNAMLTQELLSYYPFTGNKLLSRYNADVMEIARNAPDPITRGLAKLQGAAHTVNVLSRITEWWQRRAKFLAVMDDYQRRRGSSIGEAIDRLRRGEDPETVMPIADVNRAVNEALSFTWAKPAQGPAAKALVSFINNVPFASLLIPYPTFLLNALKFVFDHTPVVGFLRFTSKAEREAFKNGDTRVISQQITGALAFILARKIRDQQASDTKWDETKLPDNSYISWSRLNPFTLWLFLADVSKRMEEGTIESVKWTDLFSAAGFSGRSNIGIGALDNSIDQAFDLSKSRTAVQTLESMPGNILARFVVPLQILKDIYAQFDANERKQRDASSDPLFGPSMKNIPGVSQLLPEVESPTRKAAPTNPFPLRTEATGLLYREPKNPLEQEIDRLGFTYKETAAGGIGDPELDRYARMKQGILSEEKIMPKLQEIMHSPEYVKGSNAYKAVVLQAYLNAAKSAAVAQLLKEGLQDPYLFTREQKQKLRSYLARSSGKRMQSYMAEVLGPRWQELFGE